MASHPAHLAASRRQRSIASKHDRQPALLPIFVVLLWAMAAGLSAEQVAAYSASHRSAPQDHLTQRAITETKVSRRVERRDEHKPDTESTACITLSTRLSKSTQLMPDHRGGQSRPWCMLAACGLLALPPPAV